MTRYTKPIDAFLDLVIDMNDGVRQETFRFKETSKAFKRARSFKDMTDSITQREITATRHYNQVEVIIS